MAERGPRLTTHSLVRQHSLVESLRRHFAIARSTPSLPRTAWLARHRPHREVEQRRLPPSVVGHYHQSQAVTRGRCRYVTISQPAAEGLVSHYTLQPSSPLSHNRRSRATRPASLLHVPAKSLPSLITLQGGSSVDPSFFSPLFTLRPFHPPSSVCQSAASPFDL